LLIVDFLVPPQLFAFADSVAAAFATAATTAIAVFYPWGR
jgi:hypothetical protein